MKIALIGPGILPIPPNGWGAVESLIWDYAIELDDLGHEGVIINTPYEQEILNYLKEDTYDFAHIHYDVFFPILDKIDNIPKIALSSHYPYIDNMEMHKRDGYDKIFDFIIKNKKFYIFCISLKDYNTFKKNGADESKLLLCENGANHKTFSYYKTPQKPNRSLYLGQIYHRKKQWMYQEIECIDFVGKNTNSTSFNPNINYLGEWSDEYKKQNLSNYGNLVLLSDGENGTPLVVKEALINGLGVVVSKYAAHELDTSLPFVTVIDDEYLNDINYIKNKIEENRNICLDIRDEIREYAIENFSWEKLVKLYIKNIEKMECL